MFAVCWTGDIYPKTADDFAGVSQANKATRSLMGVRKRWKLEGCAPAELLAYKNNPSQTTVAGSVSTFTE